MDDWGDPHYRARGDVTRREIHAASTTTFSQEAAKKILAPYRKGRYAAISEGFEFKPGFVYSQVRAISARINQNFDGWPSSELKKSYRSFLGKPVFVNHQNFDPKKARGKVVAARYIENGNDKYVETVMEIDAQRFPKLAHELKTGGMDAVSMGVEAGFTICSYCDHKAVDTPDFCAHVKYHKGSTLPRRNERTGSVEDVLVYEKCYKLGFFELSYVFDPADETAVVSRVISAAAAPPPPQDEIWVPEMATPNMPTARRRHGYGEIEAPEDVDTLRGEDEGDDDTDEFKHYVESPKELRGPDLDQTKRLDRLQEQEGLDNDRRVEDVEDIGGQPMPSRNARRARRRQGGASVLVDPRTGRRYYAADEGLPPELAGGDDPSAGGPPPPPIGDEDPDAGGPPEKTDEELIQEAEDDLNQAEDAGAGIDPTNPGSDAGGTDDDYSDQDDFGDEDEDDFGGPADGDLDDGGDEDLPPWLQDVHGGDEDDDLPPPPPPHEARRNGNYARSTRNKRRGGSPMNLSQRGRVATAGRRRHYADESGHTDGGPYHTDDNDQGVQEDVFISQTPGSEAVAAPTPGDGTISNTENNLVAALSQRIQQRNAQQRRDLIAYEQITGRRLTADPAPGPGQGTLEEVSAPVGPPPGGGMGQGLIDGEGARPPVLGYRYADAVERPDEVNPTVQTGPGGEELTGDGFESLGEEPSETQPKDASRHAFRAFDQWLQRTTGRTARQHNRTFIRRQAARWCAASGLAPEALFPTLGNVLREAQRNESSTNRRSAMQRRADESLEVAAPQDRIDVEAPVRNTTDAEAQASQFDLKDFGDNAGDNLADPDLSVDTQIWAPGEGGSSVKKDSNRKADGITAVRYAEAYIEAGLADNSPDEKWKIAGLAQTMRHGTIVDRIALLDEVNKVNRVRFAALRRTAGTNRGAAPRGLPQGMGGRQMTAGTNHQAAANDYSNDVGLFIK